MAGISKAERARRASLKEGITHAEQETPLIQLVDESPQQTLAMRIWEGQSPDVAVIERVARIANALKHHGFPLDVKLPHPDAERYLNAHKTDK